MDLSDDVWYAIAAFDCLMELKDISRLFQLDSRRAMSSPGSWTDLALDPAMRLTGAQNCPTGKISKT